MVIDTSAILAVLLGEPEAGSFAHAMAADPKLLMSAVTLAESGVVIEAKKGEAGSRELDLLVYRAQIEVVPFTPDHADLARATWRRFGKAARGPGLSVGDCCSYALSKYSGEPLLARRSKFAATDVDFA